MKFRTSPQNNLWLDELIVDNFAGGGGASTGIESALGRAVDIAINHDPDAIAMHTINHPTTKHYCESVWDIKPLEVTNGQPVGLAWFSPDCKHFSKAKGASPVNKEIRGLAWVAVKWAATVKPRIIMLENVEEFTTWGRVVDGKPCPIDKGKTFKSFINALNKLGYSVEFKTLKACDFGAPTTRKRLFIIARCDGFPIVWPSPTHSAKPSNILKKYKTAGDIIDFNYPVKSIFNRKNPLVENTLRRIAKGVERFVIDNATPFIVRIGQQGFGGDNMQYSILNPLTTITTKAEHCLVIPFISNDKNKINHDVRAFLIKYYGSEKHGCQLDEPLHTITAQDRFGLVTVHGKDHHIYDIGLRMLEPRELFLAQGFPKDYIIDHDSTGKSIPKYKQVARCGNSVCPPLSEALVAANFFNQQSKVLNHA